MVAAISDIRDRQSAPAKYDPSKEYVTAAGSFSLSVGARISSLFSDEAELRLGPGGFERLLTDPEILKDVTLLVDAIVGDGVQLYPLFTDDKADPARSATAAEYSDFCAFNLSETLRRPFRDTLREAVRSAFVTGHKVAEQTYRDWTDAEGRPRLVLDKLKCKPRYAAQFVIDAYLNELGMAVWSEGRRIVVSRDKFFVPTFERVNEDPRGTAPAMLACFNWFVAKRTGCPIFVKRIEKKALPAVAGFVGANEESMPAEDGTSATKTPQQAMAESLAGFENFSSAAFAHDAKIQVVDASGNGQEFKNFFDVCNREMTRAILLQDLATNEGQHGTRAQSLTHMDVLSLRVWSLKNTVADCIRDEILRPLLYYNFGEESMALVPAVSLGDSDRRDWATDALAAAALAPLVSDSQWEAICKQLGLPPLSDGETWPDRRRKAAASAGADATAGDAGALAHLSVPEVMARHRSLASSMRRSAALRGRLREVAA